MTHKTLKHTGGGKDSLVTAPRRRDAAPEVYRAALMFGICFGHCLFLGGRELIVGDVLRTSLFNINHACVNGFVFITGYYGIRFCPSKLVRLYALACVSGSLMLFLGLRFGVVGWESGHAGVIQAKQFLVGAWFLNAYAVLMLCAPLVDTALERLPPRLLRGVLAPFFLLTFGWSFAIEQPLLGDFLPMTPGLGSFTGLSLLATYVVARLCRRFDAARLFTWPRALAALVALVCVTAVGAGEYASFFAVALAGCCFYVFLRIPWPAWVGTVARWLGPSMFAVYLLHTNDVGFALIAGIERRLVDAGWSFDWVYPIVSLLVFVVAVALDFPRRAVVWCTQRLWKPALTRLDTAWSRLFPDRA